jgi:hypothetical protein
MKMGLDGVPKIAKVSIVGLLFMTPILLMCYVICFMKDDIIDRDDRRPIQESKKPGSKSKREKIE